MLRSSASLAWRGLGPRSHYYPPRWVEVMPSWSSQRYRFEGEKEGVSPDVIAAAIKTIANIHDVDPRLPPILTLRHLSVLTSSSYSYLREIVERKRAYYKRVLLKKKVPGRTRYREIHIPERPLLEVQRWITANVLSYSKSHPLSFAFHPDSQPVFAATRHCGCRWLLKVDIEDFFHNISEGRVFPGFFGLGLLAARQFRTSAAINIDVRARWTSPHDRSRPVDFDPELQERPGGLFATRRAHQSHVIQPNHEASRRATI